MIYGRLDSLTNRVYEITRRTEPAYPDDVPLEAMPAGFGPFEYDAVNRLAVPATRTFEEKLDTPPAGRAITALLLRLSAKWTDGTLTAAQKSKIQAILDTAAAEVVAKL